VLRAGASDYQRRRSSPRSVRPAPPAGVRGPVIGRPVAGRPAIGRLPVAPGRRAAPVRRARIRRIIGCSLPLAVAVPGDGGVIREPIG